MQTVEPPSAGSQNKSPHAPGNRRHDTMHRSSVSMQQKTKPPEPVSCPLSLWDLAVQFISRKYSRFCAKKINKSEASLGHRSHDMWLQEAAEDEVRRSGSSDHYQF